MRMLRPQLLLLFLCLLARSPAMLSQTSPHPSGAYSAASSLTSSLTSSMASPMTTPEHLRREAWWPTMPAPANESYAGTAACADCHAAIVHSQQTSQMARTLAPASASDVLHRHIRQTYRSGSYTYTLAPGPSVSVSDGVQTRTALLQWSFGSGDVGQSYLWQQDGAFQENRFNYFSSLDGFDATPGRLAGPPVSLEMALSRPLDPFEARTCFACHTSRLAAPLSTGMLETGSLIPGVTCEGCHGPGAGHIAAIVSGARPGGTQIVNPARMAPAQAVDLCGACHGTPWDVRLTGAVGLPTVRFPAYRLEKSRCWGAAGDQRITCTGCHDPHQPLAREAASYDHACLACHGTGAALPAAGLAQPGHASADPASPDHLTNYPSDQPGRACPVAQQQCVTCHMPKYELPEMHYRFTDHMIRIARDGAAFPD